MDKRVVRSDLWIDAAFDRRLKQEAGVSLAVFPLSDAARAWDLLSSAHVYNISAAKDELPRQWFASAELIARCPHLLCVSSIADWSASAPSDRGSPSLPAPSVWRPSPATRCCPRKRSGAAARVG